MEVVTFDGVDYVKAAVVAKQFKYTSDYIGQLCRGKKVDARLVGRTWFVNVDSVISHRKNKHLKLKKAESRQSSDKSEETKRPLKPVVPVLNTKTIKILKDQARQPKEVTLRVKYDVDEESLIPNLVRKQTPKPKRIFIEPANSTKLRISNLGGGKQKFKTTPIPEVSLKGKLKIESYPDRELEVEEEKPDLKPKNIVIPEVTLPKENPVKRLETEKKTLIPVKLKADSAKPVIKKPGLKIAPTHQKFEKLVKLNKKTVEVKQKSVDLPVSTVNFTPLAVKTVAEEKISVFVMAAPLIATFVAILCSAVFLSLSSSIVVEDSVTKSEVVFQVANLQSILTEK